MARRARLTAIAVVVGVSLGWSGGRACGQVPSPAASQALNTLQAAFPGVQVHKSGGRIRAVYGVPMTQGATPADAAEDWLSAHAPVFGEAAPDLHLVDKVETRSGGVVLTYAQRVDGLALEDAMATVVVRRLPIPTVVYASGRLALRPPNGFAGALLGVAYANLIAQAHPAAAGLNSWSNPAPVAVHDEPQQGHGVARRVFRCVGRNLALTKSFTFYVDAAGGSVVRWHDNVKNFDVSGTVRGYRSLGGPQADEPNTFGDTTWAGTQACPNPPQLDVLPWVIVTGEDLTSGGTWSTLTSPTGEYSLPILNGHQARITASLNGTAWQLYDAGGPVIAPVPPQAITVTAGPTPVDFTFNPPPHFVPPTTQNEHATAHVNAAYHAARTWRYFKDHLEPGDDTPWLDTPVVVLVNERQSAITRCNAGNMGREVIWFSASRIASPLPQCGGGRCANAAYSTFIAHEYGHWFLGGARPAISGAQHAAFHEGFADSLAFLVNDVSVMGKRFCGCECTSPGQPTGCYDACLPAPLPSPPLPVASHVRCPLVANLQYPDCTGTSAGDPHLHGQLLSAVWLNILANVQAIESQQGLEITRQLHVDWFLLTNGGEPNSLSCPGPPPSAPGRAAHPGTLIEVLAADDDDGSIMNGTPHSPQICAAFASHGIHYPSDPSPCGESVGSVGAPPHVRFDCDRDRRLTGEDARCFGAAFNAGHPFADCDADGRVTASDIECFRAALAASLR